MNYFAYGSNLFLPKLWEDVPSATPMTAGRVRGFRLKFHKRSADGSAKCNALKTDNPEDEVWGVVYEINDSEKPALDRAEGLGRGYEERWVDVESRRGILGSYTYIAKTINDSLKPYLWYRDFVLQGATWHKLPREYIRTNIESVQAMRDSDRERAGENERILSRIVVRAWNNGAHHRNGAGYGVRLRKKDRDKLFSREWESVSLEFDDSDRVEVSLSRSFWEDCTELRKKELGNWLLRAGLAPWRTGAPPYLVLQPSGPRRFRLSK